MSFHDVLALFALGLHPLELVVRGSAMYWFLFLLFRFGLRRDASSMGLADILLLVVIADASQNAMAGTYTTITDGFVLVATIAAWSWLADWAAFRFETARRFLEPPPLLLVRHGRVIHRNLRREHVSVPELMAALREQGLESLDAVKVARMEANGAISVIRWEKGADDSAAGRMPGAGPTSAS